MATLNEIVFNIRRLAKAGADLTDDAVPPFKQVAFWVNYYRALLIKRDIDKGRTINTDVETDLGCVELKLVDKAECCTVRAGCKVLRTVKKIPKLVEFAHTNALTFVGLIDKVTQFQVTNPVKSVWSKYNRYLNQANEAFQLNEYVYVLNNSILQYINIRGIFEDPMAAVGFNTCEGVPCYTEDSQYPMAAWMLPAVTELILTKELRMVLATPADVTNDAKNQSPTSPEPKT